MQIRLQTFKSADGTLRHGKTITLLRYVYDPQKRRSKQVSIGTADRWATALPPELESILTDTELQQFRSWAAERDQQVAHEAGKNNLIRIAKHMGWAAKALDSGVVPTQPERIWKAFDVLKKALETAGYPRPPRERGRPLKSASPTPDDLISAEAYRCNEEAEQSLEQKSRSIEAHG